MHNVQVNGEDILKRQLELAEANRRLLEEKRVVAVSVMGAIGSGKTSLIERMIDRLAGQGLHVGTIAADSAGDDDHQRFLSHGADSINLNTQDDCHLDAHTVDHAMEHLPMDKLDILFIENVGNLICPADFPLGTANEMVVISTTEGDDMVRKHPKIFAQTDILVLNKIDLADAVGMDPQRVVSDYSRINPHGKAVLTDARHEKGIDDLLEALGFECTNTQ
ncbi:hydrogenase nickel incorporation protein HypB [Candidatus Bipolaricaulota bacterium]|nr:hydrogenase nickel incorporation protein HypB [Candidatus Bipolaricaulota bacterium]